MAPKNPIVISHPKSGRTWLRYIFHLTGLAVDFDHAGTHSNGRHVGRSFRGLVFDRALVDERKTIFLYRNPLDTAVSLFMQMHKREVPYFGRQEALRLFVSGRYPPSNIAKFILSPRYGVEKICAFNLGWFRLLAKNENAKIVSYEELHAEPGRVITDLIAFLKPDLLNSVDIPGLVEKTSFEQMRKIEQAENEELRLAWTNLDDPESYKVRRGEVGGHRRYLDEETIRSAQGILRRHGYDEAVSGFRTRANSGSIVDGSGARV